MGNSFFDGILGVLGTILWPMFRIIGALISVFQSIFYAFAGIGTITINGEVVNSSGMFSDLSSGSGNGGGIVYYFLTSQLVKNIFISILILAIFLLIIFTAMAFIKNAYDSKQKKWQDIVGNAIKGLGNFILVPVLCLLGVWAANFLLQAINGATSASTSNTSLDRQLFIASAYDANRARRDGVDESEAKHIAELYYKNVGSGKDIKNASELGLSFTFDPLKVDPTLGSSAQTPPETTEGEQDEGGGTTQTPTTGSAAYSAEQFAEVVDAIYSHGSGPNPWLADNNVGTTTTDDFYALVHVNYILLAGGGIFILYALGGIAFGMVQRLFTLILLFVISPAICAMYPLNDGSTVQSWKQDFVKNTLSAYGAVAGMNLFMALVPFINQIEIGTASSASGSIGALSISPSTMLFDYTLGLAPILINIAALYMVKGFIGNLSSYIGGTDALSTGAGLMSNSLNRVKKGVGHAVKGVAGVTKAGVGAFTAANRRRKAGQAYDKTHEKDLNTARDEAIKKETAQFEAANAGRIKDDSYFKDLNKAQKAARKKVEKSYKQDRKADVGGTATGGFFGSLRDSVIGGQGERFQGGLFGSVTNWLGEKSGIGKPSEIIKGIKDTRTTTADTTDNAIKRNKAVNTLLAKFDSGDIKSMISALSSDDGETLFKQLKKNDTFKEMAKGGVDPKTGKTIPAYNIESLSTFLDQLKGRTGFNQAVANYDTALTALNGFESGLKEAIEKIASSTGSGWDLKEAFSKALRGERLTYGDDAKEEDKKFANLVNGQMDQRQELQAAVKTASIEVQNSSQDNKGVDSSISSSVLSTIQANLDRIEKSQPIKDLAAELKDTLKALKTSEEQTKNALKKAIDEEKKELSTALKDLKKTSDKK